MAPGGAGRRVASVQRGLKTGSWSMCFTTVLPSRPIPQAAAVVMCKHQRGAISEFFLGSVTKCESGGAGRCCVALERPHPCSPAPQAWACCQFALFAAWHAADCTHHCKQPLVVLH